MTDSLCRSLDGGHLPGVFSGTKLAIYEIQQKIHGTLGGVSEQDRKLIPNLFNPNPHIRRIAEKRLGITVVDLVAIPNTIEDEQLVRYIASLLASKYEDSEDGKMAVNKQGYQNSNLLYEYKTGKILGLDPNCFPFLNNIINEAIHKESVERGLSEEYISRYKKLRPHDEDGVVSFTNTSGFLSFVRKIPITENTKLTKEQKQEYNIVTCSILKRCVALIDYHQEKETIEGQTKAFTNFILSGEFFHTMGFDMYDTNPSSDTDPVNPDYFSSKVFTLSRATMKKFGISYDRDIQFRVTYRAKSRDSRLQKGILNPTINRSYYIKDQGGIRLIVLGSEDTDSQKEKINILFYYCLKVVLANHFDRNRELASYVPQYRGLFELSDHELRDMLGKLGLSVKDRGFLKVKEISPEDRYRKNGAKYGLDTDFYNKYGCNCPIILKILRIRVEKYNQNIQKTLEKEMEDSSAKKCIFLRNMEVSNSNLFQCLASTMDRNNEDHVKALYAIISKHNSKGYLSSRSETLDKIRKCKSMGQEELDSLGIASIHEIAGGVSVKYIDSSKSEDKIVVPKLEVKKLGAEILFPTDRDENVAQVHIGNNVFEFDIKHIIEIAPIFIEQWTNHEKQSKSNRGTSRIVKGHSSPEWSDLKFTGKVLTGHGPCLCELQITLEEFLKKMGPFTVPESYAYFKKIFARLRTDGGIISFQELLQISQRFYEELSKRSESGSKLENGMLASDFISIIENSGQQIHPSIKNNDIDPFSLNFISAIIYDKLDPYGDSDDTYISKEGPRHPILNLEIS